MILDNKNRPVKYPIKPVKRLLKEYYMDEVSEEAAIFVRDILVEFTTILAKNAVEEFIELNKIRENHGLLPIKRLNKSTFQIVWERIYKQILDKNIGEVGTSNKILLCQDGAKNERTV